MEAINHAVFLSINAPEQADAFALALAMFFGEYLTWAIPALVGLNWLRGSARVRKAMLVATASTMLALLCNQIIGVIWPHPRPFVIGLGHTLISHAPDSSFPSDHLTLWWSVAFNLAIQNVQRGLGLVVAVVGLPMAWARIFLGVHYPLDMAGAATVALLSAWLTSRVAHWYLAPAYRLAMRIHRKLFGILIDYGWVRG